MPRKFRGGCARWNVVVSAVTVRASDSLAGMGGGSPLLPRLVRLFVAFEACLGTLSGRHGFETKDQAGLLASRFDVTACGPVTRLALLLAVDIGLELFDVGLMARHAQRIIVDELCARHLRQVGSYCRVFRLVPPSDALRPADFRLAGPKSISPVRAFARGKPNGDDAQQD